MLLSVLAVKMFAVCINDRTQHPCLRVMDSYFAAWQVDISHRIFWVKVPPSKNAKIALKVKGQGQVSPKSHHF